MNKPARLTRVLTICVLAVCSPALADGRWYKGNTHTHTWWSDGNAPPELVVKWYKDHGYDFLALSDHNILCQGDKWVSFGPNDGKQRDRAAAQCEKEFPPGYLEKRERGGKTEYRLKTLPELRTAFEEPGKFLMMQAEEISDAFEKRPIHLGAVNIDKLIPPQHGKSMTETIQNDIDAVRARQKASGKPMLVHINHPNFDWALTPEDMIPVRGDSFFEVFNGHHEVNNWGDAEHPSTDRIWDVVLSRRLGELKLPVMYGMATDDAHGYTTWGLGSANPGRGWIMVKADKLAADRIIAAMEKGDFYASTGVSLKNIECRNGTLRIDIAARPGETYTTQFIGTLRDYDRKVTTRPSADGKAVIYDYSPDIGKVLAEQTGPRASYRLTGRELYVRAKVLSSAKHPNPFAAGDVQMAWTQPVVAADAN